MDTALRLLAATLLAQTPDAAAAAAAAGGLTGGEIALYGGISLVLVARCSNGLRYG